MEKSIGMPPAIHSFLSWQKGQYSAPFSLRGKEKAAGGKKKTAKGELRRNKLHIPHPARRLRRTGLVRSVVPPFPTRIASLDSRGSPAPLQTPLKRPRRGLRPPLPWIFPGVRFVLKLFQICKTRYRCGFGKPARLSKYSASVSTSIRQIFNGRKKAICTAYRALGKPDSTAARRAF